MKWMKVQNSYEKLITALLAVFVLLIVFNFTINQTNALNNGASLSMTEIKSGLATEGNIYLNCGRWYIKQGYSGSIASTVQKNANTNEYVFCLEPGVKSFNGSLTTSNVDAMFQSVQSSVRGRTSAGIKEIWVSRILSFLDNDLRYDTGNQATLNDKRLRIMAIQILIWEVVLEERDIHFNYIGTYGSEYSSVRSLLSFNNTSYEKAFNTYYNQFADLVYKWRKIPSFSSNSTNTATNIDLKWNAKNKRYETTLTDTNDVAKYFDFGCNNTNVHLSVNGSSVVVYSNTPVSNIQLYGWNRYLRGAGDDNLVSIIQGHTHGNSQMIVSAITLNDPSRSSFFNVTTEKFKVDVNSLVDGVKQNSWMPATCDVYLNNTLVANDVRDFYIENANGGDVIKVTDFRLDSGYKMTTATTLQATVNSNVEIVPAFEIKKFTVDLNSMVDSSKYYELAKGTCDVYVDNTLVANDTKDFYETNIKWGSVVTLKDFKTNTGYTLTSSNPYSVEIKDTTELLPTYVTNQYNVVYYANQPSNASHNVTGSTSLSSHKYDISQTLSKNEYKLEGWTFKGWATSASGEVEYSDKQSVLNLSVKNNDTINLYAVWQANTYYVEFIGNASTSGTMANQTMIYDTAANLNQNTFIKTGYDYTGWNTKADGTGSKYENQQSVINLTNEAGAVIQLHAQWFNSAPIIEAPIIKVEQTVPSNIPPYIEGGKVIIQKGDPVNPLDYAKATDAQDGDITSRIAVISDLIPRDEEGKTITAGTYEVSIQVSDLGDLSTSATITILVNDPPKISAVERYFFINEPVDLDRLLEKTAAIDYEDGDITSLITVDSILYENHTIVASPMKLDTSIERKVEVYYSVQDQYKAYAETHVTMHVVSSSIDLNIQYPRYISKEYMDTLSLNSKWKVDPLLNNKLMTSLNKEASDENAIYIIEFNETNKADMKDYIINHEWTFYSNQEFYNLFKSVITKGAN